MDDQSQYMENGSEQQSAQNTNVPGAASGANAQPPDSAAAPADLPSWEKPPSWDTSPTWDNIFPPGSANYKIDDDPIRHDTTGFAQPAANEAPYMPIDAAPDQQAETFAQPAFDNNAQPMTDSPAQPAVDSPAQPAVDNLAQPVTGNTTQSTTGNAMHAATSSPMQTREEWERQQREIQDREWQNRQIMYNKQLAEQRVAQPGPQDSYAQKQQWSGQPRDVYPQQYESQVYQRDPSWQPYNPQYTQPNQQAYYSHPQAGGGQQYQNPNYYYGSVQQQSPAAQTAREDEKKGKRKTRFRVLAAVLAGAILMAAIFSTGYLAGNSGFFSGSRINQDSQPAVADTSASGDQTTQPNIVSGWANPGGLFGNQQDRPSVLPPEGQQGQNPNDNGNSGNNGGSGESGRQPAEQQPQQPQQSPQQPAQAVVSSAGAISSLTLNPPRETAMSVPDIYQKVYPSIVGVRITFQSQAYRFGGIQMPGQEQSGEGSGIIISEDGFIMTNHHVVSEVIDANTRGQFDNTKIDVFLPDDSTTAYPATIVGYDQSTDLCVLKIDKTGLKAAELGDADKLEVGEFVVAIGNPGGMEYMSSVTYGVISGLNRSIQTEGYRDIQLIQTDAAINPGNSGGALINMSGQVIGVNSIKIAASAFEGLGFAIPINAAVAICEDLMNYTYVTGRPYIGITAYSQYTEQLAEQYNMPKGVYVYEVDTSGPSDGSIKKNDIIVKFNTIVVENFASLEKEKNQYKPGDKVTIQVYRDWSTNDYTSGKYVDVEIVLGEKRN